LLLKCNLSGLTDLCRA